MIFLVSFQNKNKTTHTNKKNMGKRIFSLVWCCCWLWLLCGGGGVCFGDEDPTKGGFDIVVRGDALQEVQVREEGENGTKKEKREKGEERRERERGEKKGGEEEGKKRRREEGKE